MGTEKNGSNRLAEAFSSLIFTSTQNLFQWYPFLRALAFSRKKDEHHTKLVFYACLAVSLRTRTLFRRQSVAGPTGPSQIRRSRMVGHRRLQATQNCGAQGAGLQTKAAVEGTSRDFQSGEFSEPFSWRFIIFYMYNHTHAQRERERKEREREKERQRETEIYLSVYLSIYVYI